MCIYDLSCCLGDGYDGQASLETVSKVLKYWQLLDGSSMRTMLPVLLSAWVTFDHAAVRSAAMDSSNICSRTIFTITT